MRVFVLKEGIILKKRVKIKVWNYSIEKFLKFRNERFYTVIG